MWILLISVALTQPVMGHVQSRGILQIPTDSYTTCVQERDRVNTQWRLDGYRVSARCLRLAQY